MDSNSYTWHEIANIPAEKGVYAWYYKPELTTRDVSVVVEQVEQAIADDSPRKAEELLTKFLHDRIFFYFQEEPYIASMRGALKPTYQGALEHKPTVSDTLTRRLVENPQRLFTIRDVLENAAPSFSSPIYIGMSDNLASRIQTHKRLIERYREAPPAQPASATENTDRQRDHSFAIQVNRRKMLPSRLFVACRTIDISDNRYVDVENILNRINFPILGRN